MRRLKNSEQVRAGNKYNQETSVAIPARQLPCIYRDEMDNQRQILIDKNFIEGLQLHPMRGKSLFSQLADKAIKLCDNYLRLPGADTAFERSQSG